eukprot:154773-Pleurochrysis_carterae.AAC.1
MRQAPCRHARRGEWGLDIESWMGRRGWIVQQCHIKCARAWETVMKMCCRDGCCGRARCGRARGDRGHGDRGHGDRGHGDR